MHVDQTCWAQAMGDPLELIKFGFYSIPDGFNIAMYSNFINIIESRSNLFYFVVDVE